MPSVPKRGPKNRRRRRTWDPTPNFVPTGLLATPADLVSHLTEELPASGVVTACGGEWRLAADGLWHFWQDPAWLPSDFEDAPIPVFRENP